MARGVHAQNRRRARRETARAEAARRAAAEAEREAVVADFRAHLAARAEARQNAEFAAQGASLPLGDRGEAWDGAAAEKSYELPRDAKNYMWKDPEGDASAKSSYKLPFVADGHAVWKAITAIAGILNGAMGGLKGVSDADKAALRSKVEAYYAKARSKYGDDSIEVPWADGANAAHALAYAELGPVDDAILALAAAKWEAELAAADAECADCGHDFAMHGDGQCNVNGCDCEGFVASDGGDGPEEGSAAEGAEIFVKVTPDLSEFDGLDERIVALVEESVARAFAGLGQGIGDGSRFFVGFPSTVAGNGDNLGPWMFMNTATFDVADTLPDAHQPGSRMPARHPSPRTPKAPAAQTEAAQDLTWSAIFAPEGKMTSDGRAFAPGAITWRELPLTLMAMHETSEGGHIGAEIAGRIDRIYRDDSAYPANLIRAAGEWDTGQFGSETARMVDDKVLRGISVDLAISRYDVGPREKWFDADGNWVAEKQDDGTWMAPGYQDDPIDEYAPGAQIIAVIYEAEIGMTTVCPFPAFAEAKIEMGNSLVAGANPMFWTLSLPVADWIVHGLAADETLTAAAVESVEEPCDCEPLDVALTAAAEGLAPLKPPAEWFSVPEADEPTGLTVTEDGQVYGHAALWNVCHIGLPGCRTAPHSQTDYRFFHLGEVECEDGSRVAVGSVTLDTGHASQGLGADRTKVVSHYDDTGTVVAHVTATDGLHGIWVSGAIQPDAPAEKIRLLSGAKLSGDWRKIDGHMELVALLCVNVPGFPVPRAQALVAAAEDGETEVLALTAAGILPDITDEQAAQFAALARADEFQALAE